MSETGKDRWNSLLETLGVPADETPPASPVSEAPVSEAVAPAKPQPVSMLRPKKEAAKPKPAKPAAKAPSYWSRIAGALGLESSVEPEVVPEPVVEQPTVEPETTEPIAESILPPDHFAPRRSEEPRGRDRDEAPARGSRRPSRGEDRPRRESQREPQWETPPPTSPPPSLSQMFGSKTADLDVFGLGLGDDEPEPPRSRVPEESPRSDDDSGPVLDYDRTEDADLAFGEATEGKPETRDEEGESRDGRRRRRRRRGRGRGRGTEPTSTSAPRDEADIEPVSEDADFDFDRDEELELDTDLGAPPAPSRERPERGRPRHRDSESEGHSRGSERRSRHADRTPSDRSVSDRSVSERGDADRGGGRGEERDDDRRGGRTRRGRVERTASPPGQASYPRGDERGEARPPRDQRSPAGRGARPADDELDDDLHAADLEDDDSGEGGLPTHKKIPTWDEAVNLLIDANMATRANNPDRGGGERGRGRGGRGRGR